MPKQVAIRAEVERLVCLLWRHDVSVINHQGVHYGFVAHCECGWVSGQGKESEARADHWQHIAQVVLAAQPPGVGEPKDFPKYHEIRLDDEGGLDDIVLQCDGVHLERMDTGRWWLGVYHGDKHTTFNLVRDGKAVICTLVENDTHAPLVSASGGSTEPPHKKLDPESFIEGVKSVAAPEPSAPAPCPVRAAAGRLLAVYVDQQTAAAIGTVDALESIDASDWHEAIEQLEAALSEPCAGRAGVPRKEE